MATMTYTALPDTAEKENDAFRRIADYLDRNQFEYVEREDAGLLNIGLTTKRATFRTAIKVSQKGDLNEVLVFTSYPVMIPEGRRVAVAEAIQHGSFSLVSAVPEIDMNDGEVRLKSMVVAETAHLTDSVLDYVLYGNLNMAAMFLEPLLAFGFGNMSPISIKPILSPPSAAGQTLQ